MITFPMDWLAFVWPVSLLLVSVLGFLIEKLIRLHRGISDLWTRTTR